MGVSIGMGLASEWLHSPSGEQEGGLEQEGASPLLILNFSFAYPKPLLRFSWTFPSTKLNFSFDFTETSSPQRNDSERSPSQRRALVIETPSARQLVESQGALQSSYKWASENPQKRCTKSSKSDGSDRKIRRYFVV